MMSSSSRTSSLQEQDVEVDELLKSAASARESALSLASSLSDRLSLETADMSDLLGSSGSSLSNLGSSSVSQSSSKKVSSSKVSMSSMTRSSIDGEVVAQETIAEKSAKSAVSESQKRVEDGEVVLDVNQSCQQSSKAAMRSTEKMSMQQIDEFFKDPALQLSLKEKPTESMNFDQSSNTFEAKLNDLPDFSPDELVVNIIDNVITVVGNHEEKRDNQNYKTHQYIRKFTVPQGLKTENVAWNLGNDGVLGITAGDTVKGGKSECHLNCTIFKPKSFFKKE